MTEPWAEHAARLFEPPPAPRWATPGHLAHHLDAKTRQTPALDLIDAALVEAFSTPDARLIISMPPQEGKALALDTPIATPTGWTTMGELTVGDSVFDRHGHPCRVTWVSPTWRDRPCYDVLTGDGERITADAAHEWVARLTRNGPENIIETPALARPRSKNAQITGPTTLHLPDATLPLDPYVLGAWLGDGHTNAATITSADPEITDRIHAAGVPCRKRAAKYAWSLTPEGDRGCSPIRKALTDLGVWGDKHIPDAYMRGSHAQRLALLQGLVDTDGHVILKGQVEFTATNRRLAEQVRELVYTLGAKATLTEGRATIYGRDCGPKYRVRFYLADAAYLPRKAARCKDSSVARVRYVRAVPTESVPTRCIEVDSPDHTFLAGRSLLPTHNSQRAARRFPLWALTQNPDLRIAIASYEAGVARRWGRAIRDDITTHGTDLNLTVRPDLSAQNEWQLQGHDGGVFTAGVGGAMTGRPVDVMIIDDPVKGREQADSPTYRERAWEWWQETAATRLAPGAPVVLILTRWHEDDLAGRLLNAEDGHLWTVVSIPAQAETENDPLGRKIGEFMQSARGRTRAQWEAIKARSTSRTWAALYQQRPAPLEGAVWKAPWIDRNRARTGDVLHQLVRVLVSVDPAATSKATSDLTGIVVVGLDREGHGWVLDDRTLRGTPQEWGMAAWDALLDWSAGELVVENNQGGEMVQEVMRTTWLAVQGKRRAQQLAPKVTAIHATQSKRTRAEAVAAYYETNRVHHAADGTGRLDALETQMLTWTGDGKSPDRIDALVHGLTALFLPGHGGDGMTRARRRDRTR